MNYLLIHDESFISSSDDELGKADSYSGSLDSYQVGLQAEAKDMHIPVRPQRKKAVTAPSLTYQSPCEDFHFICIVFSLFPELSEGIDTQPFTDSIGLGPSLWGQELGVDRQGRFG